MKALPIFPNSKRKNWPQKICSLSLLSALLFSLAQPVTFAASDADDDNDPESCPAAETIERQITVNDNSLAKAITEASRDRLTKNKERLEERLATAKESCERKQVRLDNDYKKCEKKIKKTPGLYKWNVDKQVCEDQQAKNEKSNPNSGDCNNAELMKGSLRGENCKVAAQAVKDVTARTEAVNQTALVATQAYSSMQAMQATGAQADAQARQQKVLQGLAAMKLASGLNAMSGAATLKSAASGAEEASTNISGAHKDLVDYCYQSAVVAQMTPEQCFYKNAASKGILADQKNYATFERMKSAADQSQEQADKANALAKNAMIAGAVDAVVGMQALYMSRQTAQNAANFAPPPIIPGTNMALSQMGGASNGAGIGTAGALPIAGDAGGDGISLGGNDGGQIKGGLIGGRPAVFNSYKPEKSGVSGGGGGLGGGGGGRGGGSGASRRGGRKGNTASGEYANGGAGPGGFKGGGKDGAAAAGANPLADIMNKLFPPNEAGKPVVDARDIASTDAVEEEEQAETGGVMATELTIFEQVNARYRSLNGSGQI